MAHIFALNRSNGGVPKYSVHESSVTKQGMEGDCQTHLKVHGGPDKALCLFSLEIILDLQREGHPVFPGSCGENLVITGLDWSSLAPGAIMKLGDVLIEITGYTTPCGSLKSSFLNGEVTRILQDRHPGCSRLYARVLDEGRLEVGDPVSVQNAR